MPDFDAITTPLAARFASGAVTPPASYQNVRFSSGDLPNQMPPLPCVLVFLDEGEFDTGNGTRLGTHKFTVRFYYSQTADLPRDMVALRKWLTVLVDQLRLSAQLGGVVVVARVDTWKIGLLDYASQTYSGIEIGVTIRTSEPWAAVA